MSYESENQKLDFEIKMIENYISILKVQNNKKELAEYESRLEYLRRQRNKSSLQRALENPELHHVSGRVWSMNDGCFLWLLIIWAICFLIALPFLLSM